MQQRVVEEAQRLKSEALARLHFVIVNGSLLLESFFGIPGLGSLTVDAIHGNDFATLRAMVYIGALLFIAAQIATHIAYTFVDPRVRLS